MPERMGSHGEALDGGAVRGGIFRSHLDWLDSQGLPEPRRRLGQSVPPETARVLEGPILPIGWYPYRALIEMDRGILQVTGRPETAESMAVLGRHSARSNLQSAYRFYTRPAPHEFFAQVARMHSQYVDFGSEAYEALGPSACRVSLLDLRCFSKVYCWSAIGYYAEATRLQGGREPQVCETECRCEGGAACRFEIRWG
jgi:hypothetical protein